MMFNNKWHSLEQGLYASMTERPQDWKFDGPKFFRGPGVTLVRSLSDNRWTYVVGERLAYVRLSWPMHLGIEIARSREMKENQK